MFVLIRISWEILLNMETTQKKTSSIYNSYIESLGVYLPEKVESSKDTVKKCSRKFRLPLERLTGIKERHVAADDEWSLDLSIKSIENCLEKSKYSSEDIDLVICCNISKVDGPEFIFTMEPSTSIQLIDHFKMVNAHGFDVNNACAGMFTGIKLAHFFLQDDAYQTVLVVSGEYITHLTDTAQKEITSFLDPRLACLTLGDAGAAVILNKTTNKDIGFQFIDLATLGSYHEYCMAYLTDQDHGGGIMLTEAQKLSEAGIKETIGYYLKKFEKAIFPWEQVDKIIPHQTSRKSIKSAMNSLNKLVNDTVSHENNTVISLTHKGNTASTSHMVALHDCIQTGEIKPGNTVLFGITGSGLTVGAALHKFEEATKAENNSNVYTKKKSAFNLDKPSVRIREVALFNDNSSLNDSHSNIDIALDVVNNSLSNSSTEKDLIDLIIYTGVCRSKVLIEPAVAAILAGKLGINHKGINDIERYTLAFDMLNGGIGTFNALHVASEMFKHDDMCYALVVSSEDPLPMSEQSSFHHIARTGSCLILEPSGDSGEGFSNFTYANYPNHLRQLKGGCIREDGKYTLTGMVAEEYEGALIDAIETTTRKLLQEAQMTLDQFSFVIIPQLHAGFIDQVASRLGLNASQVVSALEDTGNLYTSSVAYSLNKIRDLQNHSKGDLGLVISAGSGIQVGTAIYHF